MLGLRTPSCPLVVLLALLCLIGWSQSCPVLIHSCKCVVERPKPGMGTSTAPRKKVICTNEDLLEVPDPALLPNKTGTLILSNNKITVLKNGSFYGLLDLERLDLKNNLISKLEPGAFLGLPELKRLDISNNRIGCVIPAAFQGLSGLSRLFLSGNIFSTLSAGVFDELPSLKLVDFSTDFLTCDCHLQWIAAWAKNGSAKISDRTLCAYPSALRERPVRNLKESQLTCGGGPELHTHQLIPSLRQVVFQGDRIPIQCTASYVGNTSQIIWYHNGKQVEEDEEQGIILEETIIHDCTFITSGLILSNILLSANGEWECSVSTEYGNISKKVELVVLETSASYCPADRVTNNRGDFRWPRTLAGITSYQPCLQYPFMSPNGQEKKASRRCDRSGRWEEGNYSNCLYKNDITRVLYTFVSMPINESNVLTLAHQLRMYTAEAANFSDMMDVIYVAQMMEKFIGLVDQVKDLADVMLEMASNMMMVDDRILWNAQVEDKACSSIVQTVEKIAGLTLSSHSQDLSVSTKNIALEAFLIIPNSFVGLGCTAFQRRDGGRGHHKADRDRKEQETNTHTDQRLKFRCTTGQTNMSLTNFHVKNSLALASVYLPQSLLALSSSQTCKLQILAFRNGKLFRSVGNSSRLAEDGKRRSISTPVIYVGTRGCGISNLTDSVTVTLRHLVKGSDPLPAQWNFKALEGYGGWSSEGCQLLSEEPNITSMQCLQLGNFAVLTELNTFSSQSEHALSEILYPVIYCTAVLLLCLFTTIITYIVNHSSIQISLKGWHMLLNLCFHIAMTSAVFAGGISLPQDLIVCQAVSIILHYSSLSTLLWMALKARVIYKELTHKPQPQQEGEVTQPPHRPMLRLYLIAGGIPLIICGITAAVNINNYRDNSPYCCLVWRPSLGAFYVPAGLILLVTWIYLLFAGINLKRQPTDQKDPAEANDAPQAHGGISHLLSDSTSISVTLNSAAPVDVDTMYSLQVQFWSLVTVHILYIVLWIFGAFAVSQGWYLNIIFSCLYGVTAIALGLFIFIHHCVRRSDVQRSWFSCCPSSYTDSLPVQAYVHTSSPVDDSPQVYIGSNPEVENSVKSTSSPSNSINSNTGPCKITNLQVAQNQAETCPPKPPSCEESEQTNNKFVTAPSRYMNNLHGRRNHKSRTKQYREGKHHRLKVLRGPSSDQPSSESGSVHNSHSESYHSKNSPLNNGRGVAARDPEGALTHSEGSDSSGQQAQDFARAQRKSASRDNLKQANSMERETKRRSYPLNTGNQNGVLKGSKYDINLAPAESTTVMKTGLWKSETTV